MSFIFKKSGTVTKPPATLGQSAINCKTSSGNGAPKTFWLKFPASPPEKKPKPKPELIISNGLAEDLPKYSLKDVAAMVIESKKTLRLHMKAGLLPYYSAGRLGAKRATYRFSEANIKIYLANISKQEAFEPCPSIKPQKVHTGSMTSSSTNVAFTALFPTKPSKPKSKLSPMKSCSKSKPGKTWSKKG
jgi:hypothetical protein